MDTSPLSKYLGRTDLVNSIADLKVVSGLSKSNTTYYCLELSFTNGYSRRLFLNDAETFAITNAFEQSDINKTIDADF